METFHSLIMKRKHFCGVRMHDISYEGQPLQLLSLQQSECGKERDLQENKKLHCSVKLHVRTCSETRCFNCTDAICTTQPHRIGTVDRRDQVQ